MKINLRVVYALALIPLAGCSTTGYQDDPRHGFAVKQAIERQTHQAMVESADPDLLHCMMMMRQRNSARGQDGESARAPLQRHQRELQKASPLQDTKPLVSQ
jgi:hypothetical protein